MEQIVELTKQAIKEASLIIKNHHYQTVNFKTSNKDIVTDCDTAIEAFLRDKLMQIDPQATIIGEEGDKCESERMWIIDPIDGTTNFANLGFMYTISVGYYVNKEPVFGICYDVADDKMYVGITGQGAYINDEKVTVGVNNRAENEMLVDCAVTTLESWPSVAELTKHARGHRSYGVATLSIIYVALNKVDVYVSHGNKCWDYAGAVVFFNECGGHYKLENDFFTTKPNRCIFVKNKELIEKLW